MAPRTALILLLAAALSAGCRFPLGPVPPRASEQASQGDDRFRASQRLVLEGLDADERGDRARARSRFERALQVDSSNPWAYLALARLQVDAGQGGQALRTIDRASALFEAREPESPGALVHCDGIRGAALALEGRDAEARPLLDAVARRAPGVWGDRHLSAAELR